MTSFMATEYDGLVATSARTRSRDDCTHCSSVSGRVILCRVGNSSPPALLRPVDQALVDTVLPSAAERHDPSDHPLTGFGW